ncbi:CHAT domain-containing protein [Nocardia salmonicida]|uniref:CHAT domain-containing protein n=1 Tax=Nocardia salmonicida TaxID=53431 RepID=UPI0037AC8F03
MQVGDAAIVQHARTRWPRLFADSELAALVNASPIDLAELLRDMMNALPSGPLGASEAGRLRQLMMLLDGLLARSPTALPGPELAAMLARYRRAERIPASVDRLVKVLARSVSLPSVLGDRNIGLPDPGRRPEVVDAEIVDPVASEGESDTRYLRASFDDHNHDQPLPFGIECTLAIDVTATDSALAGPLPGLSTLFGSGDGDTIELTVFLASPDFEIFGQAQRPLRVTRTGPSRGKARFDLRPTRVGRCELTATVAVQANFLTELRITAPVGESGEFEVEVVGRPLSSAVALEARDLSLIISPDTGGHKITVVGSRSWSAILPLSDDELAAAATAARAAMSEVLTGEYGGKFVFLESIAIPTEVADQALEQLARAGRRLFQKLFLGPEAGGDLRAVGEWLVNYANDPELRLTLKIVASRVHIPWSLLYLRDLNGAQPCSWDGFLGMRHIIEQVPHQLLPEATARAIDSRPELSVGLHINPTIDTANRTTWVRDHDRYWLDTVSTRTPLTVVRRSTRTAMMDALADPSNSDKLMYFYCHATADDADPDRSAIIMGTTRDRSSFATLGDLHLDAPTDIPLHGRPLIVLNACASAGLSPRFYDGIVPFFLAKMARGVVGTETKTPALFAVHWAEALLERLFDGEDIGAAMLDVRLRFLREHRNPLGLLYTMYGDANTRIAPALHGPKAENLHAHPS